MNLTIDIGNSRQKWALFDGGRIVQAGVADMPLPEVRVERALVCATGRPDWGRLVAGSQFERLNPRLRPEVLSYRTRLPIQLDYATPQTLGADRIAAACGAYRLEGGHGCVIVDAGTCITVDYLDAHGVYHGGAILPGIEIKFRALHTFTEKLPLLEAVDGRHTPTTGRTTEESMRAGVMAATRFAVEGFVAHYRRRETGVRVLLTGGDVDRLLGGGQLRVDSYVLEPQLVMIGMNEILETKD